ncbi:bifunctional phosphopantothenoylcysteine decarboxylase/phosphopantothenate synthase [Klebsiella pneumoniae subsp. pneumoniae]|nr:bifunctional phosphopantothenoylcysteine decarboxylase/phosphopantothenate synthase [Klebsiella pneumoniae subsp. pneumoniae]
MMTLAGKKIVLGVSGGIAAYKTPELVRRLRERGAEVRVAMTEAAKAFITPTQPAGGIRLSGFRQPARSGGGSGNGPY